MTFDEVLAQVIELLQREGRVSYRALKIRFSLDDEYLEGLKDEIIAAQRLASDEDGKVLVWTSASPVPDSKFQVSGSQSPAPSTQPPAVGRWTPDAGLSSGERRQLTVMFCDLVGSTALSGQLDPEELREVVRAYQETCAAVILRYEGHIAQYLGDGLLVYFGYPVAHEDDARRAVRAGLEIVSALQQSNAPEQPTVGAHSRAPLQVRIGIHTGLVVVGEISTGGRAEQLALGETPNLAARIQALAQPDTVLISGATRKLIEGYFDDQTLGSQVLKGVTAPVEVYHVLGESQARSRLDVKGSLTPLVGREQEVGLLLERWERAKEGSGQVVLLSGEPGIGKSRLVQALKERVAVDAPVELECRCSPYYQNSAFYPVIDHLQRMLEFRPDDSSAHKLGKLEETLERYGFTLPETVLLLASLLSLPLSERYPPLNLTPQRQKQKTQEVLLAWLLKETERQTLLSVWEDVHWIDPSTLELLSLLLDQAPTRRMCIVLTFRPEFRPPWALRSHLAQLTLSRLGRKQAEEMVENVAGGKALSVEILQQIVAKTDGVPLFVEELTKTVLESVGATHASLSLPLAIPATLHNSLMARLDRLGPAKEVAQLGATLGREFSYELIRAVSPLGETSLQQALVKLVEAELLYQRGLLPQATYIFKHALIQDAAYQSLLKSTRQQYHSQIAQVLEERFTETKETQPELLAQHYTDAGLVEQAIPYWQQAGQRATQRSANAEAISHLTKGLELLKTLPDTPERVQQELSLQLALGPALMATKSVGHSDVESAYTRARELCQQIGDTPQLFPALWGLRRFYSLRADFKTAQELEMHLLRLAQSAQDPALLLEARLARGLTSFWLGQMACARECFAQGIALYNPQQHHSHAFLYGTDPGIACHSYLAFALWHLAYPDQALQESQRSLVLAQELTHPFSLVYALSCSTWVHHLRREAQAAQERIEKAIRLATEQGFPFWVAWGSVLRGWALAMQGQGEEGIAQTRQGIATHQALGAELGLTWFLAILTEACGTGGQSEDGLQVLAEALDAVDKRGECAYEAELYRLKGTLTLKQSGVRGPESEVEKEAEECFHKAIEIARRQQAKLLELRAVMSLSRLWQQRGKKEEARQMLVEIYGWFTEGFDTTDLQEARALLEELAH